MFEEQIKCSFPLSSPSCPQPRHYLIAGNEYRARLSMDRTIRFVLFSSYFLVNNRKRERALGRDRGRLQESRRKSMRNDFLREATERAASGASGRFENADQQSCPVDRACRARRRQLTVGFPLLSSTQRDDTGSTNNRAECTFIAYLFLSILEQADTGV